jgi:hypothetical protein
LYYWRTDLTSVLNFVLKETLIFSTLKEAAKALYPLNFIISMLILKDFTKNTKNLSGHMVEALCYKPEDHGIKSP